MPIQLLDLELRKADIRTRMPFRYGIATLTEVPYLLLFATFEVDGIRTQGVAADMLPPKWFTKIPDAHPADEIADMLSVIRHAATAAMDMGSQESLFGWWRELNERCQGASEMADFPPLLRGFGVSLLERTAWHALAEVRQRPFHRLVRENAAQIDLGVIHPELVDSVPADWLPESPSGSIAARHTIGLADPLTDAQIPADERLEDGLPQSLEACIGFYGLTHFKIKLPADPSVAQQRLRDLARIFEQHSPLARITVDGNEFFTQADAFRAYWESLQSDPAVRRMLQDRLLLIEQPVHRDQALSSSVAEPFAAWEDRPPIIIDESDAETTSFRTALQLGYEGTSHKNCKGVIKGLANACLVKYHNRSHRANGQGKPLLLTGEDLANLPPVALLQDLAVDAVLGLEHVERNGHHYFAGLSPFPPQLHQPMMDAHPDLFHWHTCPDGSRWPAVSVSEGRLQLATVNQAALGHACPLLPEWFERVPD